MFVGTCLCVEYGCILYTIEIAMDSAKFVFPQLNRCCGRREVLVCATFE